jgi:hypothetical protein
MINNLRKNVMLLFSRIIPIVLEIIVILLAILLVSIDVETGFILLIASEIYYTLVFPRVIFFGFKVRIELYDAIKPFCLWFKIPANKLRDKATNTTSNKFKRNFYKGLMYVIFVKIATINILRSFFKPLEYKYTNISEAFFSLPNVLILILGAGISLGLYLHLTGIFLILLCLSFSLFFLLLDFYGQLIGEFFIRNKEIPFCQSYYESIARFELRSQQYRYGPVRYVFTRAAAKSVNFFAKPTTSTVVGVTGIAVGGGLAISSFINDYYNRQNTTINTDKEIQVKREKMKHDSDTAENMMKHDRARWAHELEMEKIKQQASSKK